MEDCGFHHSINPKSSSKYGIMAKASSAHGLSGDNNSGGILARPVVFCHFQVQVGFCLETCGWEGR